MKYLLDISGCKLLLSHTQLEIITETIAGAEMLVSKYVAGKAAGSSSYQPHIETMLMHDWFRTNVIEDDYIDTIKLTMKLQKEET